jgi:hypothetical protein
MKLAVFYCERRLNHSEEYGVRLSLLFNRIVTSEGNIKETLTDLVCHVIHFLAVKDKILVEQETLKWTYLGPNCSLVNNKGDKRVSIAHCMNTNGVGLIV